MMIRYQNKKLLLQLKDLFQFLSIISIASKFSSQMGMGSSGYSRGLSRDDGITNPYQTVTSCGNNISVTTIILWGSKNAGNQGKQANLKNIYDYNS